MLIRTLLVTAGFLAANLGPALSDTVTAAVTAWDCARRTLTLEDKSQFSSIPDKFAIPENLKAGDLVTVEYYSSEHNGIEEIYSVSFVHRQSGDGPALQLSAKRQ